MALARDAQAPAVNLILTGTVQSEGGESLHAVKIAVPEMNFERLLELQPAGHLKVTLSTASATHLHCHLSAPGFEDKDITVAVLKGGADIGTVHLKPYIRINLDQAVEIKGGFAGIDFWLESLVPGNYIVDKVILTASGEKRASGGCFDASPRLAFRFTASATRPAKSPISLPLILHVMLAKDDDLGNEIHIDGEITPEPCGGSSVRLVAPYSFALQPSDVKTVIKFRFEVPLAITTASGQVVHPDWQHSTVGISLHGEGIISATAR
jgi:hypothetical protein